MLKITLTDKNRYIECISKLLELVDNNLNFIDFVKLNIDNYDAFVKFFNVCTKEYLFDDCVLGLFAIKCKYLKDFSYNFLRIPECEFVEYIRKI